MIENVHCKVTILHLDTPLGPMTKSRHGPYRISIIFMLGAFLRDGFDCFVWRRAATLHFETATSINYFLMITHFNSSLIFLVYSSTISICAIFDICDSSIASISISSENRKLGMESLIGSYGMPILFLEVCCFETIPAFNTAKPLEFSEDFLFYFDFPRISSFALIANFHIQDPPKSVLFLGIGVKNDHLKPQNSARILGELCENYGRIIGEL